MVIQVSIIPRSSMNKVEQISDGVYKVKVTAPPVDNKANEALIKALAKHFDIPRQSIAILRGATKKRKLVAILDK